MKNRDYQIDYEFLVKHAEAEKVYFRSLCHEREILREKITTSESYMEIRSMSIDMTMKNRKINESKKTLQKITDRLAMLLKIAILEP